MTTQDKINAEIDQLIDLRAEWAKSKQRYHNNGMPESVGYAQREINTINKKLQSLRNQLRELGHYGKMMSFTCT